MLAARIAKRHHGSLGASSHAALGLVGTAPNFVL